MYIFKLKIMNHKIYVEILMPMRKTLIDEIIFENLIQGDKDKY